MTITAHIRDLDTRSDIEGAVIELSGVANRFVTGPDGRVTFATPRGDYTLTIRRAGYASIEGGFKVLRPGDFGLMMRKLQPGERLGATAQLVVRVYDSQFGEPVEGAVVSVLEGTEAVADGNESRAVTDGSGRASFDGLEPRLAYLAVERIGYADRTEPVALHADRTTAVEVPMTIEAIPLRPLHVEVRSRFLEAHGYYRRLDQGAVMRLLTRQSIEERGSPLISDAFARVPGLRIDRPTTHRAHLQVRDCPLAVFVDGVEWNIDIEGTVNIDQIPPHWVEVAEIYWGPRTPPKYRGQHNGGCGSVLIWTRQAVGGSRNERNQP